MKNFFKSGRYLFWIAAAAMMLGVFIFGASIGGEYRNEDTGGGLAMFVGGVLVWLRANKKERQFEKSVRNSAPGPL